MLGQLRDAASHAASMYGGGWGLGATVAAVIIGGMLVPLPFGLGYSASVALYALGWGWHRHWDGSR